MEMGLSQGEVNPSSFPLHLAGGFSAFLPCMEQQEALGRSQTDTSTFLSSRTGNQNNPLFFINYLVSHLKKTR
jgi:hypothetical protein